MKNNKKNGGVSRAIRNTGATSSELISLVIIISFITALTLISVEILKNKFQHDIENALQNVLDITKEGFIHEENKQLKAVQLHASSTELVEIAETLLANKSNPSESTYQHSLAQLRHYFSQDLAEQRHLGFYIIGPENINIASAHNDDLGKTNLLTSQPELLDKLWSGEATLTRIQHSDIELKDESGRPISNPATMFVGAPIRNDKNDVIALLTLRINPYNELFPLLEKEHLGATGETYAFDKSGLMLSHSRFENELKELHLLDKLEAEDHAIRLYDPGSNLLENPELGNEIKPVLTDMAASAIRGEPGSNIEGYRDYRGVNVVGAWHWFPDVDIGITTEQNVSDAYSTFHYVRKLSLIVSGVICLLIIVLYAITATKRQKIKVSEAYLDAIYKTSIDALIIINKQGIIQKCNPTTEELFGYTSDELVGQNVRILMPDPHRSQHDAYLDNYQKSGTANKETTVIGTVREYEAIKADGSLFPIELNVNPLELPDGTLFAGSIRDISKRKQAQQLAHDNEQHLINTLRHAHVGTWDWSKETQTMSYTGNTAQIYGLESEGTIEVCNRPSLDFIQCVHPDDQEMVKNAVNSSSLSDNEFNIEYRVVWPDGSTHWINARGDVIFDNHGIPTNTMGIIQDITQQKELGQELQESEQALRESENHLSNILNTAPVNIYIKNLEGKYIFVNPAWKDSVSLSTKNVLGKDDYDLFNSEVAAVHENTQQMALKNKQDITFEEEFTTKDGENKSFMTSIFPLQNTNGEVYALGGWSTEITGLKQTQHDLELAKHEADASSHAKSAFLATMSHEIRTPMNGVVGIVDVLGHTSLDDSQKKLVKTISDSSFTLLGIIDDILDFSKIDAGKMELEQITISMDDILDGVGETLLPLATKKDIELITFCDPGLPEFYGDPVRLRQILYNISGNAIKFTESSENSRGRVIMRCERPNTIGDMNTLIFRIQDNGIGMPVTVQERLFSPFSQAESSTTREFGGTGLGLTISKRLTELMGGDISVESEEGEGTLFTVSLPLTPVKDRSETLENKLKDIPVLFFNGDEVIDKILSRYLSAEEMSLYDPSSAELNQITDEQQESPQPLVAIIVDTHDNKSYIADIQTQLREQYAEKTQLSFIIISQGLRRKARPLCDDTLQLDMNSLSRSTFINAVSGSVGLTEPDLGLKEDKASLETNTILSAEDAALKGTLFLVAEDNPVNQRVISHQLNLLGFSAEIANDGKEALAMWKQGNGKYSLLLTDCHMPHMDGYDLSREIRKIEGKIESCLPIIAITADAMKGTKQECLDAGMNDYITKPLQISVLSSKLNEWLPVNNDTAAVQIENTEEEVADDNKHTAIDPKSLPELLQSDDHSLLSEFYHEFLKSATEIIEQISQATEEDNMKKVSSEAHKLKSSSYTFGANTLADCCLLFETSGKLGESEVVKENIEPLTSFLKQAENWIVEHYPNK